jgi:hypothetical protein
VTTATWVPPACASGEAEVLVLACANAFVPLPEPPSARTPQVFHVTVASMPNEAEVLVLACALLLRTQSEQLGAWVAKVSEESEKFSPEWSAPRAWAPRTSLVSRVARQALKLNEAEAGAVARVLSAHLVAIDEPAQAVATYLQRLSVQGKGRQLDGPPRPSDNGHHRMRLSMAMVPAAATISAQGEELRAALHGGRCRERQCTAMLPAAPPTAREARAEAAARAMQEQLLAAEEKLRAAPECQRKAVKAAATKAKAEGAREARDRVAAERLQLKEDTRAAWEALAAEQRAAEECLSARKRQAKAEADAARQAAAEEMRAVQERLAEGEQQAKAEAAAAREAAAEEMRQPGGPQRRAAGARASTRSASARSRTVTPSSRRCCRRHSPR